MIDDGLTPNQMCQCLPAPRARQSNPVAMVKSVMIYPVY